MKNTRIFLVDALRGLAIILMVIFHTAFDLNMFGIYKVDLYSGFWGFTARSAEFMFLILVGFSLYLSYKNRKPYGVFLKRQISRAVKLLLIALGITFATLMIYPEGYIRFGVLHLISLGIAAGALIIPYPRLNFIMIFLCLIAGGIFTNIHANTELFLLFGITPYNFFTIDYFPIFPWLALILSGISFARIMNLKKLLAHNKHIPGLGFLETAGRHSLFIYLVHQPVILGIIWLLSKINVLK
jgi:uncharacterized membrane protein